jgi:putative hydrolase of the HAD superfamily
MSFPKALLLDAMGTLIGLKRSVGQIYAEVAADHGLEVEAAVLSKAFAQAYSQAPPMAFAKVTTSHLEQAERNWWQKCIQATFKAAGISNLPIGLGSDLFERFGSAEPWLVYPEVPAALDRCRQRGLRLVVVSNFDRRLHRLLDSLGLNDLLDDVLVSSEIGAAKPDPTALLLALARLDLQPSQVWHVGDSAADVEAAQRAGITCLQVIRHGDPIAELSGPTAAAAAPAAVPFQAN